MYTFFKLDLLDFVRLSNSLSLSAPLIRVCILNNINLGVHLSPFIEKTQLWIL